MSEAEIEMELRSSIARLLRDRCAIETVAALADGPDHWDEGLWSALTEVGVPGLAVGEEHGGGGAGFALAAAVQEELGRRLAPVPTVGQVAVQAALMAAGSDTAERWLPRLASGEVVAGVAVGRTADGWGVADDVHASRGSDGWSLHGHVPIVADAAAARLLLVASITDDGDPSLFLTEIDPSTAVHALEALDATRSLGAVTLDGPAECVTGPFKYDAVLAAAENAALVILAADVVGVGAEATDLAVEYAKTRHQFGRAIGSFQAISHRAADMFVAVESARALVAAAAGALDEDPGSSETRIAVRLAAAHALDAAVAATQGCVQIHGGMGFTWEHPAHRYLRRAKGAEALIALPDRLREQAVTAVLHSRKEDSHA
ncbi:acyl-CoA dehydrogenase family protein [Actinomadura sp. NPDC048394]|jgi:alkylation response protein AidB-like acyl-CoA dehydrogenase|uniref:acyl-CoA dehydrogenase family protein n=1 Tax=Actinomadura sp. NPDC048394 TaxID=3158223 RepID=UPI0033D93648